MISEGPCDTEDWSNDAENSALITEVNVILNILCPNPIFALFESVSLKNATHLTFPLSNASFICHNNILSLLCISQQVAYSHLIEIKRHIMCLVRLHVLNYFNVYFEFPLTLSCSPG